MLPATVLFQSHRFEFREFMIEDLSAVHSYASDLEVVRYLAWGPNSLEQSKMFLLSALEEQKASPRIVYNLAIICKTDGHVMGGIHAERDPLERSIEIGYCLARFSWGQGVAKESTTALIHFMKQKYPHDKFVATSDTRNMASMKVLEYCGFEKIKIITNHMTLRDGPRDTVVYELLT